MHGHAHRPAQCVGEHATYLERRGATGDDFPLQAEQRFSEPYTAPMRRFPVIIGPTAGGKSALALALAGALEQAGRQAEIISADAFQVYRGMDIGTAKPSWSERKRIPHHLIDIREPTDSFTVDDWLRLAEPIIARLLDHGATPIVVGGTNLYIKALLEGMFDGPEPDPALRAELQSLSSAELHAELTRIDPVAANRIHPNDRRRAIRAIEVHRQTGSPISSLQSQWDRRRRADALLIGLQWPTETINRRINARVKKMIELGLVEEARGLWTAGRLGAQASQALGYKQLIEHFAGRCSLDQAVERIRIETRRFAKNQRTWIRRLLAPCPNAPSPITIDAGESSAEEYTQHIVDQLVMVT